MTFSDGVLSDKIKIRARFLNLARLHDISYEPTQKGREAADVLQNVLSDPRIDPVIQRGVIVSCAGAQKRFSKTLQKLKERRPPVNPKTTDGIAEELLYLNATIQEDFFERYQEVQSCLENFYGASISFAAQRDADLTIKAVQELISKSENNVPLALLGKGCHGPKSDKSTFANLVFAGTGLPAAEDALAAMTDLERTARKESSLLRKKNMYESIVKLNDRIQEFCESKTEFDSIKKSASVLAIQAMKLRPSQDEVDEDQRIEEIARGLAAERNMVRLAAERCARSSTPCGIDDKNLVDRFMASIPRLYEVAIARCAAGICSDHDKAMIRVYRTTESMGH